MVCRMCKFRFWRMEEPSRPSWAHDPTRAFDPPTDAPFREEYRITPATKSVFSWMTGHSADAAKPSPQEAAVSTAELMGRLSHYSDGVRTHQPFPNRVVPAAQWAIPNTNRLTPPGAFGLLLFALTTVVGRAQAAVPARWAAAEPGHHLGRPARYDRRALCRLPARQAAGGLGADADRGAVRRGAREHLSHLSSTCFSAFPCCFSAFPCCFSAFQCL